MTKYSKKLVANIKQIKKDTLSPHTKRERETHVERDRHTQKKERETNIYRETERSQLN
jgi:hypothetical protein